MENAAQITAASTRAARLAQVGTSWRLLRCPSCCTSCFQPAACIGDGARLGLVDGKRTLVVRVAVAACTVLHCPAAVAAAAHDCAVAACQEFNRKSSFPVTQVTKWMRLWNIIRLWCFYWKHRCARGVLLLLLAVSCLGG